MRHAKHSAVVMGATGLVSLVLAMGGALFDGQSTAQVVVQPALAQPLPPTAIVDVPGLMRLFNHPLYAGLRERMAQEPADQDQWDELMARGLQAAEIANLVALRPVEPERTGWIRDAAALQQAGVALSDAARERQWEQTRQAYESLIQACNGCHQTRAPDRAPQLEL